MASAVTTAASHVLLARRVTGTNDAAVQRAALLLDDIRTRQLVVSALPQVTLADPFYNTVGESVGLDPPQSLCALCVAFLQVFVGLYVNGNCRRVDIQRWITQCEQIHDKCRAERPQQAYLPTRLLRVASDKVWLVDKVDLVNERQPLGGPSNLKTPEEQVPQFLAASYRWNLPKSHDAESTVRHMLTRQSEKALRAGIPKEWLPLTIRDMCTITHRLGYLYLWVDRFCIRQDPEDWLEEASQMAMVYKHAALVIAASCAAGEDSGCFRSRRAGGAGILPMFLTPRAPLATCSSGPTPQDSRRAGQPQIPGLECEDADRDDKANSKLGHLSDRGWVFQERLFAIRTAYFTRDQVWWQCSQIEATEQVPTFMSDVSFKITSLLAAHLQAGIWAWHRLVEQYSELVFTKWYDRLPGLSSLAHEVQSTQRSDAPGETYLAGLWKSTFIKDLCWTSPSGQADLKEGAAPSWSWASMFGKPEYDLTKEIIQPDEFRGDDFAKLEDMGLTHETKDTFGRVSDGWVILRSYAREVEISRNRNPPTNSEPSTSMRFTAFEKNGACLDQLFILSPSFDRGRCAMPRPGGAPLSVVFLPLLVQHGYGMRRPEHDFYCLMLLPTQATATPTARTRQSPLESPYGKDPDGVEFQRVGLCLLRAQSGQSHRCQEWITSSPDRCVIVR
ncbi:hypothetical protein Micbo1qcDRAFT_196892 [Microdochium bolleyi]|uniref:Heterokaryon incompatibility domain-containing protein n=1 Tax=Microdochium bolleyi TaxID=196109 RepID=A0A136IVL8_9PEZI|nr:hypothetical protein Micbo1qcDRAFT_196892 [Microdochium bolleyi]